MNSEIAALPDNETMKAELVRLIEIVRMFRKVSFLSLDTEAGVARGTFGRLSDPSKTVNYDTMYKMDAFLRGLIATEEERSGGRFSTQTDQ